MRMKVMNFLEKRKNSGKPGRKKREGFSMIETTTAIFLAGVALLALAQLFTFSVMNNRRSDRMTNSIFLAQQQIDFLRNLPATNLSDLAASPVDEQIDVNNDGNMDFRRVTVLRAVGFNWDVRVRVFPASQLLTSVEDLINYPTQHQIRADIGTVISR
jgi:type II secretory pathway pseudopilin PulG